MKLAISSPGRYASFLRQLPQLVWFRCRRNPRTSHIPTPSPLRAPSAQGRVTRATASLAGGTPLMGGDWRAGPSDPSPSETAARAHRRRAGGMGAQRHLGSRSQMWLGTEPQHALPPKGKGYPRDGRCPRYSELVCINEGRMPST